MSPSPSKYENIIVKIIKVEKGKCPTYRENPKNGETGICWKIRKYPYKKTENKYTLKWIFFFQKRKMLKSKCEIYKNKPGEIRMKIQHINTKCKI